jgi:small subunit ribosomal protein S6
LAEYELVLMLDAGLDEGTREKLASDTRTLIESGGELKHADNWGVRKMAYEIDQRTEADYRFYRFVAENPLLEQLDHNLKIADGTLRFRVFRVDPRAPVIAPPQSAASREPADRERAAPPAAEPTPVAAPEQSPAAPEAPAAPPPETAEPAPEAAEPEPAAPVEPGPAAAPEAPEAP